MSASSKGDAAREAEPAELRSGSATRVFEGELVDEIPSKRSLVPNVPFQAAPSPQERTGGRLGSWGERLWHAVEAAVERTGTMPLLQRISEELAVHPVMQRLNAVTAQAARVASPAVDWASRMLPPAMGFARAAVEAVASGEATRTLTGAAIDAGVVVGKLSRRVEPLSVEVDPFGEDPSTVARFEPIFDFLHDRYFRIEVLGAQRVPKGASLLACNHSGALPLDGPMLRTVLRRECGRQDARWLVEDAVFHAPFMGVSLNRLGAVRACPENAERLLAMGLPLAVFPEGLLGLSKGFGRRYQLQRFGRGGFVKLAMRTGVPIVPVAIVGAEESFPLLARISLRRASVPYLPLTPLLPLPMKWTVSFLEPVDLSAFGPKGAEDLALVSRLSAEIRDSIQRELDRIVGQRRLRFQARA